MGRRPKPQAIERTVFDAEAIGCNCQICPLRLLGKLPIDPQFEPRAGVRLHILQDSPNRYEEKLGYPTANPASRLLDKALDAAGAHNYSQSYSLLCNTLGAKDNEIKKAVECCKPRVRREIQTLQRSQESDELGNLWVLSLGQRAFQAVSDKVGSVDAWLGSPVRAGTYSVLPAHELSFVLLKEGKSRTGLFFKFVERAWQFASSMLAPFEWPGDIVDNVTETLEKIAIVAEAGAEVSVDIETRGLGISDEISCIGFAVADSNCCVQLPASREDEEFIRRILHSGIMVGQNIAAFDRQVLAHHGYGLTPQYEDTLLAAAILDPQLPRNLGALTSAEFHGEAHKAEFKRDVETGILAGDIWGSTDPLIERERRRYCMRDAYVTLLVRQRQKHRLQEYGQDLYDSLKKLSDIAISMRKSGLEWDFEASTELKQKYTARRETIREQLRKGAATLGLADFNPGSTKQLADLFYSKMKIAPMLWTPEGKPSTGDDALVEILKCDNPTAQEFARKVGDYREADKALGTYIVGLWPKDSQTRVFGVWKAHTAISGRWGCTEVPLQTLSSEMRRLIKATPGKLMVEADLPSAEVRTVMLFAGDDEMIALLNDNGDLYSTCATEMFGRKVSKRENKKLRQLGKLIILASNYGASADTVWRQIIKQEMEDDDGVMKRVMEIFPALSVRQVDALQSGYFRKCPKIQLWWQSEQEASAERGYYLSPFDGRKLRFYGHVDRNLMANFPNQATVAWWMNRSLLDVHAELRPDDTLLTYVHDSICIESPEKGIERTRLLLHTKMEGDMQYKGRRIQMRPVESKVGRTLQEVK